MEVTLMITSEPFSINKMYYNKGVKKIRTQAARNWSYQIFEHLSRPYNQQQLNKFRDHFDRTKMGIDIFIQVRYNDKKLFRQKGGFSSAGMDCSNFEKPLIDLIFDPKYFDRDPPDGCKNLNMDDVVIGRLLSEKRPAHGEDNYMLVTLKSFEIKEWK
jgi:hypothetical protein